MKTSVWTISLILVLGCGASAEIVDRIVAQVNNDIITLSDLNREMAEVRQELGGKFAGDQLEAELQKAEKTVLEDLVRQKLLLQKGDELGFGANVDVQVSATVQRILEENKLKDTQELERALAQQGMTLPAFRERIRRSIITNSLVQEFVGSRITLLTQEIEKFYNDHTADYTTPEEVSLSEILIPFAESEAAAKLRADVVHKQLAGGEPFATMASQFSKGPTANKGGDIGTYVTSKLNPDIAKAIASIAEGEFTPVTKTAEGFAIYRVDSRKKAGLQPLEDVKTEIKNRIWQEKFSPEYDKFIAMLKEEAYIQIFGDTK